MSEETKETPPADPSVVELAKEPFSQNIDGKDFEFRRLGMGRGLAVIASHLERRLIKEIGEKAKAFPDKDSRDAFIRENLALLPKGSDMNRLAVVTMVGDESFLQSDGKDGLPPSMDEDMLRDIIERGQRKGKQQDLRDALSSMQLGDLVLLMYRVLGIRSDRDVAIAEIGGTPEKKG